MAAWQDLEARLDGVVFGRFGEQVRLSFLKNGEVDPDRQAADLVGVLAVGSDEIERIPGRNVAVAAGFAKLILDGSTYAGPLVRAGDRVRANERAGQPWFEVRAVEDRHSNLIILALSEV